MIEAIILFVIMILVAVFGGNIKSFDPPPSPQKRGYTVPKPPILQSQPAPAGTGKKIKFSGNRVVRTFSKSTREIIGADKVEPMMNSRTAGEKSKPRKELPRPLPHIPLA